MRDEVLGNGARMRVYETVARNPGVTVGDIAHEVGLSPPTVRYHLDVLSREDLVLALDRGNRLLYFRNRKEFSDGERVLVALLRSAEAMRVYQVIEASPWILRGEVGERIGCSRASVNWHLRQLMGAGLVSEAREHGRGFLYVTRAGREALTRVARRVWPEPQASVATTAG